MESTVLAIQARVLFWVGIAWLAIGLWNGFDPITVTWRAAAAAVLAMIFAGKLMRFVAEAINEKLSAEMAELEAAPAPQAAASPAPAAPPAVPPRRCA